MADDVDEEQSETLEDLFKGSQSEAPADGAEDSEAETVESNAPGAEQDDEVAGSGESEADDNGEVDSADGDGGGRGEDDRAATERRDAEGSTRAGGTGDAVGEVPTTGAPTTDETAAVEDSAPSARGGTSAGDSAPPARGGTAAGGIDESLLDADGRSRPAQPVGGGGERLTTGIEALDHHLGGGIPPGRIVSFVATADTQSELLVKQLAAQHDCLYLSTLRPKWEVQEEVTDYVQKRAASTVETDVQIEQLTADSRLDSARRHIEQLDRQSVVVVDSANELETSEKDRYAYFIDELKRALWDTGSVGLLYCIEAEQPSAGRTVTLRRSDVIWRLRRSEDVGGIRHELLVSKFRGGRALIEPLTLWLTDEVLMDESGAGD